MKIGLGALAIGVCITLAGSAWADPETLLKCEGKATEGQRYTVAGGWQPFPNPDRAVTVVRDKGKLTVTLDGERSYSTLLVFALPQVGIKTFKVLGQNGVERFQVFENPSTGKPAVRHTITAGSDGSHVYNIRVTTLDSCPVVAADVAVQKLAALDEAAKH
jgi:hypothetical protein